MEVYMYSAKPDDDDDEPDYLVKYGNAAPRESDTEQTIISTEISELNADSNDIGSTGDSLSGIEGFNGDDVPLWDGEV